MSSTSASQVLAAENVIFATNLAAAGAQEHVLSGGVLTIGLAEACFVRVRGVAGDGLGAQGRR